VPRPELLSFLYFAIYLVLLEGMPRNGRAIYWLVPLQILWVNTQGIFAVGLVLIGCYWAGSTLAFLPLPRGWRGLGGSFTCHAGLSYEPATVSKPQCIGGVTRQ